MAWSICFSALALVLVVLRLQVATEVAPHEGVFDELLAWMQQGIDKWVPEENRLGLKPLNETLTTRGRTFVAKRDLRKGELLVRFPRENIMHAGYFLGEGSPFATSLSKAKNLSANATEKLVYLSKWADIVPHTWLALYILQQRRLGEKSFWHQYLKLVPSKLPENPVFYAEKDLDWLQGSTFVHQAKRRLETWTKQYQIVSQLIKGFANKVSLKQFLWARSSVVSRAFGQKLPGFSSEESRKIRYGKSGSEHSDFMVPIGDMLDHRSPQQLEWMYDDATRSYDIWVREDVAAGGELFVSYGIKSNADYLLMYGFVVPDLPKSDYPVCNVPVVLGLNGVPDQEAKRVWLIGANPDVKRNYYIAFTLREAWEKEPDNMLAHARLLELRDMKEVNRQMSPGTKNCQRIPNEKAIKNGAANANMTLPLCPNPVSIRNEQAAVKQCLRVIRVAIQGYPTTLEEDELLLPTLEGIPASLVTLRRDEKVVLHYWERFFDLALDALKHGSGRSIERRCNEVLGEAKCSVEDNYYMRTTLYELLETTKKHREKTKLLGGNSTLDPGILASKAPWLILVLMVAAVVWWRNASQRQRPGSNGCHSVAGVTPGRKDKKAKRT